MSPSPGTYSLLNKERINFFLAECTHVETKGPGILVEASKEKSSHRSKRFFCVKIKELSRSGKKRQKYESFYNGSRQLFSKEKFLS